MKLFLKFSGCSGIGSCRSLPNCVPQFSLCKIGSGVISGSHLVLALSLPYPRRRGYPFRLPRSGRLLRHGRSTRHSDGVFGKEIGLEAGWARTGGDLTLRTTWLSVDRMSLGDFWTSDRIRRVVIHSLFVTHLFIQRTLFKHLQCVEPRNKNIHFTGQIE